MSAYYNENDPYAAQWLRNLIAAGHIAAGDVDERSIADVQPDDLRGYAQCHFFAGIGGWSYALRIAGWDDGRPVWTGSYPCQPLSGAGQRKGHADERHLWPAFYRLIAERRPATVFGEQVASSDGREWLAGVRADLEAVGYAVGAADLCAAGVGAPHIRQRLYWLAQSKGEQPHRSGNARRGWREFADDSSNERLADAASGGWRECREASQPRRGGHADSGLEPRRLAYADGGLAGDGGLQRGGQHGQQPQDGGAGGVGDACGQRRQQERRGASGDEAANEGRAAQFDHVAASASAARLWDAFALIPCTDGKARRVEPGSFPLVTRLPENMGCDGASEVSPFRIITDPKTGKSIGQAPWRIGMLRAYGNAIVPQVAAKFIAAFTECAP